MYYDEKSNFTRPVSVGYIGPSVTPYGMLNPGYRIYTVDGIYNDSTFVGVFRFPFFPAELFAFFRKRNFVILCDFSMCWTTRTTT